MTPCEPPTRARTFHINYSFQAIAGFSQSIVRHARQAAAKLSQGSEKGPKYPDPGHGCLTPA